GDMDWSWARAAPTVTTDRTADSANIRFISIMLPPKRVAPMEADAETGAHPLTPPHLPTARTEPLFRGDCAATAARGSYGRAATTARMLHVQAGPSCRPRLSIRRTIEATVATIGRRPIALG